jgi:hypothetical protein
MAAILSLGCILFYSCPNFWLPSSQDFVLVGYIYSWFWFWIYWFWLWIYWCGRRHANTPNSLPHQHCDPLPERVDISQIRSDSEHRSCPDTIPISHNNNRVSAINGLLYKLDMFNDKNLKWCNSAQYQDLMLFLVIKRLKRSPVAFQILFC